MVTESENNYPIRVSLDVMKNSPHSKYAEKFCSKKYPIHCALTVAKTNSQVIDEVKAVIKGASKDELRYSKQTNYYAGVTLHIFTNKADLIRPIADKISSHDLFIDYLDNEKRIFPRDLVSLAQDVQKGAMQGIRQ